MLKKPKIAIMLDENTSKGGQNYEASKDYFRAISDNGGLPYGIPYCNDFISQAVKEFDGFFSVGGSIAFPDEYYMPGHKSLFPASERLDIETGIMKSFLLADKPILASCHGMQLLGALYGCKLETGLGDAHKAAHDVKLITGTRLQKLTGVFTMTVNSRHSEYIAQSSDRVTVSAISTDGIIESIEIPDRKFAIGLQWHQENFCRQSHPANAVFSEFIRSSG